MNNLDSQLFGKIGIIILMIAMSLTACGKKTDKDASQAEDTMEKNETTLKAEKCDGKGSAFSGTYLIEGSSGTGKCSDNDEAVETPEIQFLMECTQSEDQFNCKKKDIDLKGCINQDGSFTISSDTNLGFIGEIINTSGAKSVTYLSVIKAKMSDGKGEGKLNYSHVSTNGKQKKGCNLSWNLTLEADHE